MQAPFKQAAKWLMLIAGFMLCTACTQLQPTQVSWDGGYAPARMPATVGTLGPSGGIF